MVKELEQGVALFETKPLISFIVVRGRRVSCKCPGNDTAHLGTLNLLDQTLNQIALERTTALAFSMA
jgi:hypothetical protein